jgi:hypothetical protein
VEGQLPSLGIYVAATIGDKSHKLENRRRHRKQEKERIYPTFSGLWSTFCLALLSHPPMTLHRCPVDIFTHSRKAASNCKLAGHGCSGTKCGKLVYPQWAPCLPSHRPRKATIRLASGYTALVNFTKTRLDVALPPVLSGRHEVNHRSSFLARDYSGTPRREIDQKH